MMFEKVVTFLADPIYLRILYLTLILFVAAWIIWYMYIQLSKRELFRLKYLSYEDSPSFWEYALYIVKFIFVFPAFIFLWFILFVVCLTLLSNNQDIGKVMIIGIVLVSVIRISAYASQKMAEDLAKLLPLTVLAGILLNPSFITLNVKTSDIYALSPYLITFAKYLLFIILLELILKFGHYIHTKYAKKDKSKAG